MNSPKDKNLWFRPPVERKRKAPPQPAGANAKKLCVSPRTWKKNGGEGVQAGLEEISDLRHYPHPDVAVGRYAKIAYGVLMDKYLTQSAKVVFCFLAGAHFHKGVPIVKMTKRDLEESCHISRVTLLDSLRLLVARGHIEDLGKDRYMLLHPFYEGTSK